MTRAAECLLTGGGAGDLLPGGERAGGAGDHPGRGAARHPPRLQDNQQGPVRGQSCCDHRYRDTPRIDTKYI